MQKIITIYAALITLVALTFALRIQSLSELSKDLIKDNYKLINMSEELLNDINIKQTEYPELMSKYLTAEYDAMTRVVAIYCND